MSFQPEENVDIHAVRGGGFTQEFEFWEDAAETVPFSLEPWTLRVVIAGIGVLTVGAGLTKTAVNKFLMTLTPKQTSKKDQAHYYLEAKEGSGAPEFFIKGDVYFEAP